jgi:hypothetical protein
MHSLFLSKVSVNELLQVPQQGPCGQNCPFTSPFLHISQIPYKIHLNKEMYPSLRGPMNGASSMFPKSGAHMETDVHFQSLT